MSESFWETYKNSVSYKQVLEVYYQFSKNQCEVVETLLEDLKISLDEDHVKENLADMLKDSLTF
jgi:predicted transcriptional regulator